MNVYRTVATGRSAGSGAFTLLIASLLAPSLLVGCSVYDASLLARGSDDGTPETLRGDGGGSMLDAGARGSGLQPGPGADAAQEGSSLDAHDSSSSMSDGGLDDVTVVLDARVGDGGWDLDSGESDGGGFAADAGGALDAGGMQDAAVDAAAGDAGGAEDAGATQDASMDAAMADAGPGCGGTVVFGHCWYLAPTAASCNQFCADHGGYDPDTRHYTGTPEQGGSAEDCEGILGALGHSGAVMMGTRGDGRGFGCHVWSGTAWWLSSPAFDPSQSDGSATIACACYE